MAQGWLVLVQGTYILWRGNDSYITRLMVYIAEIQTKNTHHGDADNCAGGASFQQHYTQVLHQQHLFTILLCLRQTLHRLSGVLWRNTRRNIKI